MRCLRFSRAVLPLLGLLAAAAMASALLGTPIARAAKAPPPTPTPLDGGWVYYYGLVGGARQIFRSSADGSSQGVVPGAPAEYGTGPDVGYPSELTHDGSRWYLAVTSDNFDAVFPNQPGLQVALEIDAVRQGDSVGLRLTDNRAACLAIHLGDNSMARPVWTTNAAGTRDMVISWVGTQWADQDANPADCETFIGAGIYRADLVYDGAGAVAGIGTPTLALPLSVNADLSVNLASFRWSPDAASVAYTARPGSANGGPLMLAAAGSPVSSHTQLAAGTYSWLDWSADQDAGAAGLQTSIAFVGRSGGTRPKSGVWSVQPNGSNLKLLAQGSGSYSYGYGTVMWSPVGSHLAYVETVSGGSFGFPGIRQIRRMAKDGSGNVVLVSPGPDYSSVLWGLNWTGAD